jgi:hypothetical protein
MYVHYENTVLNKLIISLVKPFSNLDEERVLPFDKFDDLDIVKIIDTIPNEELTILSSSFIEPLMLEKKVPPDVPLKVTFIIRDAEEIETDVYSVLNWYIYWTNMLNVLQDEDIDREIVDNVYQYFYKLPTINQRRVVEYLSSLLQFSRSRYIEVLRNETLPMIMNRGKNYIEQKNRELSRDKTNSATKVIKDIRCSLCISTYLESAFQILEKSNVDVVLLFEVNLKSYTVDVTMVPRNEKVPFSHLITQRSGFLSNFRISFQEFVDLLTN